MWSNDGRGSLIRRIAALVLCALITVAYTPGMAYALEGQTDKNDADNATVSISADDQELLLNEATNVRVTADGASLEKIQFNDSYGFRDEEDPNDDNGTAFSTRVSFYDEGQHEIYARVKLEGNSEWIETEHITITATSNGTAGSFDITKVNDGGIFSLEVTRGDTLKIECEQADNADHYWVDVNQNDGSGGGPWVGHFADTDSNTIYFNTIELQPGNYHLSIGADGIGYGSSHSDNFISLTVNKPDVLEGQVYLNVSKTNPETWEEITYSAYCPGADWIEVFPDYDNDMGWRESPGGEAFSGRATYGRGGAHTLKAIAYTYDEENDKDNFLAEASTDIIVTSKGPLNIELPELPQLIIAGEDGLSFTVNKPEQADRFKVDVWFDKDGYEGDNNLFWDETDEDRLTVDLSQDKFEEGMTVRVRVEAWGRGYDTSEVETSIPVTGEISDAVTIEASDTEVLVNEDIDVTVRTNGGAMIDRIQLFGGYDFWGEEDPDDNGTRYRRGLNFSDAGDFIVFARVKLQDDDTWITTEPVNIKVTSNGRTGDFNIISVNDDTDFDLEVTRGDTLIIKCEDAENASHYWIDAERYEDGDWGWNEDYAHSNSSTIYFNTIGLEPGEYRLNAFANDTGYENSRSGNSILLTVKDRDINPGEFYFEVSSTELQTCEDFTYAAYYPGAEWIEVFMDNTGNRGWSQDSHGEDSISESSSYRSEGTYELKAVAYGKYDEETDEHEILATDSRTITVSAPNGSLSIERPELPSLMVAGQDGLSFTVAKPENADGIQVDVWFDKEGYEGDNNLFWDETNEDSLTVNIPQDKFEEGMTVRVRAEAFGRGYDSSAVEVSIPVTGETSDAVTIEASDTEVLVNEDIEVTVRTKDGAAIDTIQMFAGYDFWGEDGPDNEEGTEYTSRFSFYDTGEHTVFARVRLRGSDEWISTEPITINVTSKGRTGDFNIISVNDDTDFDLEVTRGDTLIIKCEDAENASHYWIDAERYEDGDWGWNEDYAHSNSSTIYFNTIGLEPGEYRISAFANDTGYENSRSGNFILLTVKDRDINPGEFYFEVSSTELQTCEDFTYAAYYPGAEWIEVFMDYTGNRGWSQDSHGEDSISESSSYRSEGTYELKAVAYGKDNEETDEHEILASKSINMGVSAPNGVLSIERPELPPLIVAGQDGLSFTVEKPENADGIQVDVWFDMDGYDGDHNLFRDETDEDSLTVNIPQDKFEEGMTVRVRAEAFGHGYDCSAVEASIPVTGEASDELTITAPKKEVLVCEDTTIVVDAGDKKIDKVRIFNGNFYWDEQDPDPDDNTRYTAVENFDTPGTYTVFAKVRLAGSDEWLTTPSVSIKVTANGIAGNFEITGVNGGEPQDIEVTQGDLVSVTYEAAEHADHYWIELRNNNGGWAGHWSDTNQFTAALETADLEPGEYIVSVGANGYGYENNYSGNTFRLKVAVAHEWGTPTYTWSPDASKCTATVTCMREGCGHEETEEVDTTSAVKTPATCVAKGTTTYTATFTNTLFETQTKDVEDIDALEHDYDAPVYEWEEDGSACTATAACKREGCGHVETEEVNTTSAVKTPATCTAKGTTTYTATFTNTLFETQTKDVEDIDALEHDYDAPVYEWEEDGSACTATAACKREGCGHVETEEVNTASAVKTPATCAAKGTTTYTATFTNTLFETQTKDVEDIAIDETAHDYGTPSYEWEEDGSACTATAICKNDKAHVVTEKVDTTSAVKTAATCTEKGTTTYTATFTNALFESQTKDVEDIDALGHDYQLVPGSSAEPTCTEAGKEADKECSRCHDKIAGAEIAALGHDYQLVPGSSVEPTCTEAGKEADKECSRCHDKTAGTAIEALGHDYQIVPDSSVDPTCTESGKEADKECSRCHDKTAGAEIAALGHDPEKVEAKAATKDAEGNIEYYKCKRCEKLFKDAECKTEISQADTVVPKLEPTAEEKAAAEAKDNLSKVVEDAKKIGQGNYTDESFKALQDAIAAAETLAKDEKATAEQLKAAADKVTAAKAALKEKAAAPAAPPTPPAPPAPAVVDGQTEVISGSTVEVTSAADKEVAFKKARKGSKATVPATVSINGESYKVTSVAAKAFKGRGTKSVVIGKNVKKLDKNAFYGSTVTTVTLKTKVLTKAKVKGSLKGSKVKTVKVSVGGKAQNKKFVKKYKPYFTKANAGKAATVK